MTFTIISTIYFVLTANWMRKQVFDVSKPISLYMQTFFVFFLVMAAAGLVDIFFWATLKPT